MEDEKMNKCLRKMSILLVFVLMISMIGCSGKSETKTIKIATKPMTEQFILGEMLRFLIEADTDLTVEMTKGVGGGTSNIHPAIIKGDFDLYPEYTGTAWSFVLKETGIPDDETLYKELKKKYEKEYNLKWVGLYGFNNTYGLVVRKEIAEKYNIKSYSDLAKYSKNLVFVAEYDFYQTYYCGTVVRMDTLKKYPELEAVLMKMDNIITDNEMSELNNKVEADGIDEKELARDFLIEKGLLEK